MLLRTPEYFLLLMLVGENSLRRLCALCARRTETNLNSDVVIPPNAERLLRNKLQPNSEFMSLCVFFRTLTSTRRRSIELELFLPRGINTDFTESKANISQIVGQLWVTDAMSSYYDRHGENNCRIPQFTVLQVCM